MAKKKELDSKIEELALKLTEDMLAGAEMDPDLVSCFKGVSSYYSSTRKLGKVQDVEDSDGKGGFSGARDRIAAASSESSSGSDRGTVVPFGTHAKPTADEF